MKSGTEPTTQKTSVRISREVWRRAKIRAMDEGVEFATLVQRALEIYLVSTEKKPKPR